MADQRRRGGRGRSGRGGRIPKKGEQGSQAAAYDETFVSFPEDVSGLQVPSPLDPGAVEAVMERTLERERRVAASLQRLAPDHPDSGLRDMLIQAERHRDVLGQLARDLGASVSRGNGGEASEDVWDLVTTQRLAWLGWKTLQRASHASGDRRIDRVVRPVLREKERHAEVLEALALAEATRGLFREQE